MSDRPPRQTPLVNEAARARLLRFTQEDGFDEKYGTDTRPFDLTGTGQVHIPTLPRVFHAMMARIPFDPQSFTFVDVGAGKGRVVMLASAYPFRRCIGVELGPSAVEVATNNLAIFESAERKCQDLSMVHADALTYEYPLEDLFIYFFNPFVGDAATTERWLAVLQRSLSIHPRRVILAYQAAEFAALVEGSGFLHRFGPQGQGWQNHDVAAIHASLESGDYSYSVYSNFDS